jgi:hypothetical protein
MTIRQTNAKRSCSLALRSATVSSASPCASCETDGVCSCITPLPEFPIHQVPESAGFVTTSLSRRLPSSSSHLQTTDLGDEDQATTRSRRGFHARHGRWQVFCTRVRSFGLLSGWFEPRGFDVSGGQLVPELAPLRSSYADPTSSTSTKASPGPVLVTPRIFHLPSITAPTMGLNRPAKSRSFWNSFPCLQRWMVYVFCVRFSAMLRQCASAARARASYRGIDAGLAGILLLRPSYPWVIPANATSACSLQ